MVMVDLPFVDFHCHFPSPNSIYCTAKPQPPALENQTFLYSQGLLPQYWTFQRQEELLQNLNKPELQLGEVGLDKRFKEVLSLEEQEKNLLTMLQYAKNNNKIVTIHSVQATERTISILKQVTLAPWRTIWHGFTGSIETAKLLFRLGVFVSVGPRAAERLQALASVHPRFVLETDYEGNNQTQYNTLLEAHYTNCAKQLGWTVEHLKEHCYGQAQTLTN